MFLTLLLVTFVISLLVSFLVARLFQRPILQLPGDVLVLLLVAGVLGMLTVRAQGASGIGTRGAQAVR